MYESENACPASLDSRVLATHNTRRRRSNSNRQPLSDNNMNVLTTRSSAKSSFVIVHEDDINPQMYTPTSFRPLPLIHSTSSFKEPFRPFIDLSIQSYGRNVSSKPLSSLASDRASAMLPPLPTLSQPLFSPSDSTTSPFQIPPSVSHPNSPYVPWDFPVRREIIRSATPVSTYSRPYSRTGAQAPEPFGSNDPVSVVRSSKMKKRLKDIKHSLKRQVTTAIRRVGTLTSGFKHRQLSERADHSIDVNDPSASDPIMSLPKLPSPSAASFDSSYTTSLGTWLAARQREAANAEHDPRHTMTLEEYERRGSWVDFYNTEGGCGIIDCTIHSSTRSCSECTSTHESSIVRLLYQIDSRSPSPLAPSFRHGRSRSPSVPASERSVIISHSRLRPVSSLGTISITRREREMTVPGGWISNSPS